MRFEPTRLKDAMVVVAEPHADHRGSFTRMFCEREFAAHGLETVFPQHSQSRTVARGAIRGLHFQRAPHEETKLVRCVRGAIFDVIVDLRPASPTFRQWQGFELTPEDGRQLYIPKGFAHGFQTLVTDCEAGYLISAFHAPESASGVRHDDPALGVIWPLAVTDLSDKDRNWPLLGPLPG